MKRYWSPERLRKLIKVDGRQFGFPPERLTTDAIFMRQLQEKFSEKKKKLYDVFVDLEGAFNQVPRKAIEWALRRQKVPEKLVTAVIHVSVCEMKIKDKNSCRNIRGF